MFGMPLDVALWPLHNFLLKLEELGHLIPGWRWVCGAPSIPVLFVTVGAGIHQLVGPVLLRASSAWAVCPLGQLHPWFAHLMIPATSTLAASPAFGTLPTFALFAALAVHLLCTLLCALLLLHALSSSTCLSVLSLVLERPRSWSLRPSCRVCSRMGASSGSACGGGLAHLHCASSSRDDCCLATI